MESCSESEANNVVDPRLNGLLSILTDLRKKSKTEKLVQGDTQRIIDFFLDGIDIKSLVSDYFFSMNARDSSTGKFSCDGALYCVHDFVRTDAFVQGVIYDTLTLRQQFGRPLVVTEAGCGPAGILGITSALTDPTAEVTLLDLNPLSALIAEKVVEKFCMQGRVRVVCANALTWTPEKLQDLLISETMFTALTKGEYLPQILTHLSKFVQPQGKIVPEYVTVECGIEDCSTGVMVAPFTEGQRFQFSPNSTQNFSFVDAVSIFPSPVVLREGKMYNRLICSTVGIAPSIAIGPSSGSHITDPLVIGEEFGDGGIRSGLKVHYPVGVPYDDDNNRLIGADVSPL